MSEHKRGEERIMRVTEIDGERTSWADEGELVRECRNANTREPMADAFDVGGIFKCSECGESYRFTELPYPFCPFCGAKVVAK